MTDNATSFPTARFSRPAAFFWLLRLNRTIMVAVIAGAGAYASGASIRDSLLMTLAGWCLAVGGFSLDFFADRDLDVKGPRGAMRHNPLADGSLSPRTGLTFSLAFLLASFIITLLIHPWAFIPWGAIVAVVIGLARHLFDTPLGRAITLGLLQALYLILGGTVGSLHTGLWLLAGMFFFAMFGGRGMIDIRDFPQDEATRVQTLPRRYGIKHTACFTTVCLLIASALSLAAYFTGEFNRTYLYLDIVFIFVTVVGGWFFLVNPTPQLAHILTIVYMMGAGIVICLAIILGSV